MIIVLISIIAILYLALEWQDRFKIPSPLTLIGLSYFLHLAANRIPVLTGNHKTFAELVLLLLPILLIADSMELKVRDLKEHGLSLFYLAVVTVGLSIFVAIITSDTIFAEYHLSVPATIVLFAMVLATDPVSVVSIFSKFELPHKLKILAEGESLFNDATALIVFVFIGLHALSGHAITLSYVIKTSIMVSLGSALLGGFIGVLALMMMKSTTNRISELLILILAGYSAFELSEHFYFLINLFGGHSHMHLSGILSCIFATITVNHVLTQTITDENTTITEEQSKLRRESELTDSSDSRIKATLSKIVFTVEERTRHQRSKEDVMLLALVANTILFACMAEIINIGDLLRYSKEIAVMFVATTLIRAIMMAKFAFITNQTTKMTNVNYRWWAILTFAGIKGGLSVVMLSMIPNTYKHIEMFTAIVLGVVLLSTFVYSLGLLAIINRHRDTFRQEALAELAEH